MPKYRVELKRSAQKELEDLSSALIERTLTKLQALEENPRPTGCKKLKGGDREYRIRIGEYRAIYLIDDAKRLVSVTRIRHRSEVYE